MNLNNKSAIVIGGAGGIGKEICLSLVQRGLTKLAVIDILDDKQAIDELDFKFSHIQFIYKKCSVTDEQALCSVMTIIKNTMNQLDLVINSAGVLDDKNPKRTIEINYLGVVNSTLIGIELMRKDKGMNGGVIVNIASIAALRRHFWLPVYAGTKHAILGFTRSLKNQKFFETTGVKFMTICPGVTATPLTTKDNFLGKFLFPDMLDDVVKMIDFDTFPRQLPDVVPKCVIAALDDGENGSTWQCENDKIEKLNIYDYPRF